MSLKARRTVVGFGVPVALAGLTAAAVVVLGPDQSVRSAFDRARTRAQQPEPVITLLPAPTATGDQSLGTPGGVWSPSAADQVRSWWNAGPKDRLDDFLNDIQAFVKASGALGESGQARLDAVDAACQKLGGDVRAAIRLEPSPDPQAQADWSTALSSLSKLSEHCHKGVTQRDGAALAAMTTDIKTATAAEQKLEQRVTDILEGPPG
jgi:hypothetical protein